MATVTDAEAPTPKPGNAEQKKKAEQDCSTRALLDRIRNDVTKAQVEKDIHNQKVAALEEHLRQLEEYDTKIKTAGDAYKQGIDAVCTGLEELSKAVEQSKSSYECLVDEKQRKEAAKILEDLRARREALQACAWQLSDDVIDKQCELEHEKAKVTQEEEQLSELLKGLDLKTKELADLKELKDIIGCSDVVTNECRYAFYLDLEQRLMADCPSAEDYVRDLACKVKELDNARQLVREAEGGLRVAQGDRDLAKKLRDDLAGSWRDELCRAVTARSVKPLPPQIATPCGGAPGPADTKGTSTGSPADTGEQKQGEEPADGEQEEDPSSPEPAEAD